MTQQIQAAILELLRAFADEFDIAQLANPTPQSRLYGIGGSLDSLALVSFITDLEQTLAAKLGISVTLADEKAMSARNSPFKDVATLTAYIASLTQGSANSQGTQTQENSAQNAADSHTPKGE